jgi:hypothetical protein
MTCAAPIELEALIAYWLGELDEKAEAPLEAHFMGCAHCARRLEWLAACGAGVRAAVRGGTIGVSLTPRFLQAMKDQGLRIRDYPAAPGEVVACTITAEDDAVVGRLRAPLAGVRRVDALHTVDAGGRRMHWRSEDVPFDEETGEVLFIPSSAELRRMPAHTWRVRLLAVDEAGARPLGEYAFAHTPS